MPINAGYEYFNAEKIYLAAKTLDEKIVALEGMIRAAPKHKSSENFVAELKTRLKKFLEKKEKGKKVGKGKAGIKKEGYQCALIGMPNSGKSSLLGAMTNAKPSVSIHPFTTRVPELGTMDYYGVRAQIVDLPSIGSPNFDSGIANNADCLLVVINKIEEIAEIEKVLTRATGKKIIVFTKIDLLSSEERRKLEDRCRSKRIGVNFVSSNGEGILDLKKRIFESMNMIRVYMKEPGKAASNIPAVMPIGSTVKDVAEGIFHGFSKKVKETRITGPSGKFMNQKVGIGHELKDRDVVEFHTN